MNNSLARLYQLHSQSLATATVTPVQQSDNELTTNHPSVVDNDHERLTLTPQSPNLDNKDHDEPHVDDSQSTKATAQFVVCD